MLSPHLMVLRFLVNTNDSVMLSYAYAEPIRPPVRIASFFIFGYGIALVNRIIFFVNYLNTRKLNCFGRFNFSMNCLIVNSYYSDLIEVIFSDRFIKFTNPDAFTLIEHTHIIR